MAGGTLAKGESNAWNAVVMIKIGTNILSQTVQRNLARATTDLGTASERLSSGQRINKGSDDAAGLSIATSLRVDSRVFAQALRNLSDGISFSTIAESAMDSLTSVVDRIQELTTQSMNGTFEDKQRQSMQQEVTALQSEYNRKSCCVVTPFIDALPGRKPL